jgi:hypothetical protein
MSFEQNVIPDFDYIMVDAHFPVHNITLRARTCAPLDKTRNGLETSLTFCI